MPKFHFCQGLLGREEGRSEAVVEGYWGKWGKDKATGGCCARVCQGESEWGALHTLDATTRHCHGAVQGGVVSALSELHHGYGRYVLVPVQ